MENCRTAYQKKKHRIFEIIQIGNREDTISLTMDILIVMMIVLNIICMFLNTFDEMRPYFGIIQVVETITILFFCVEYALRLWTAQYLYPEKSTVQARIRYLYSFDGIVDLCTILPFFFLTGFVVFRMLRVVRIFHLFRLNSQYDSFHVITAVLMEKKNQMISSVFIIVVLMFASSLCMYSAEHEAQPEAFRNAFSGIWWSMSTLLTVGYGDIYPVTLIGRCMAIVIAFLGVGAVAIPSGIISAGFVEQYAKLKQNGCKQNSEAQVCQKREEERKEESEMKYDFTSIIDRNGYDAIAVEGVGGGGQIPQRPREGFDFIPMWVADMNFATCPGITEAIRKRIEHPLFGYFSPTKAYYDAMIRWQKTYHQAEVKVTDISIDHGVLGGVVSAAGCFAAAGDPILVHSPTYIGFTESLQNCGYRLVHSELKKDEQGIYRMDYHDMEKKIRDNHIHLAIFCSPHNPTGRVWEREELRQAMEVFERNEVTVISDEIWSDLILNGGRHIPTQSVSEYAKMHTIAMYAPTKTFNLAGMEGSYNIIYNRTIRDRVRATASKSHYNSLNVLSMHALIGAYSDEGMQWREELCQVLSENVNYACDFIHRELKGVEVTKPQGTYMLFVDCTKWCEEHQKSIEEVLHAGWDVGIGWQNGVPFHGPHHLRINLSLPFSKVQEALLRMKQYVFIEE